MECERRRPSLDLHLSLSEELDRTRCCSPVDFLDRVLCSDVALMFELARLGRWLLEEALRPRTPPPLLEREPLPIGFSPEEGLLTCALLLPRLLLMDGSFSPETERRTPRPPPLCLGGPSSPLLDGDAALPKFREDWVRSVAARISCSLSSEEWVRLTQARLWEDGGSCLRGGVLLRVVLYEADRPVLLFLLGPMPLPSSLSTDVETLILSTEEARLSLLPRR
mmetsp:Transcript_42583/g.65438  ORF Transcript_42583/g.65438 Transcript_42583/m.65438 type:complete len:223 (+) Transcript_42583:551-1219(+)